MSEHEDEKFEQELRKVRPAALPEPLLDRLVAAHPVKRRAPAASSPDAGWWPLLRWLAPLSAAGAVAGLLLLQWNRPPSVIPVATVPAPAKPAAVTQDIEVDRELVASFDTVAAMPDGQSMRFSCNEWNEQVVVRDPVHGIVVEHTVPHLEVLPVGLETF